MVGCPAAAVAGFPLLLAGCRCRGPLEGDRSDAQLGPHGESALGFSNASLCKLFTVTNSNLPFLDTLQVCRGTAVMMVSPTSGTEEIENPFLQD